MKQQIKVFEAFAGIGTQKMALDRLGLNFEYIGISEIDKYAIASYKAIHGDNIKNYGDISKINIDELPDFDLFTYSFPCQSISTAGKMEGLEKNSGTKSSLLWECHRIIKNKKPKYLLMENVKNLISKKFKSYFEEWCKELESLGYTNYYSVLNAKDYGIPQNRERVFMVSILGEHKPYEFPEKIVLTKKLKDILEDNIDEKYYLSEEMVKTFTKNQKPPQQKPNNDTIINLGNASKHNTSQAGRVYSEKGLSPTIAAGTHGYSNGYIHVEGNINISTHESINRVYGQDGISPTLTTMEGGHRQPKILEEPIICASRGRYIKDKAPGQPTKQKLEFGTNISNCLTSVQKDNYVFLNKNDNYRIRKLTPKECWRLMGIDDKDFEKAKKINSNTQLYKQAGNAIVVDVLENIFKKLFERKD